MGIDQIPGQDVKPQQSRDVSSAIESSAENHKAKEDPEEKHGRSPLYWLQMLVGELHWSFVFGVVTIYGVSQGVGGGIWDLASDYYWKDVQKVQPSAAQFYSGITSIPWIIKPLWGLLTDVLPIAGYRRRPYFVIAGILGVISTLTLCVHNRLLVVFALLAMTGESAGVAIADVTIDACVAQNSITHPSLASGMQSMCGMSSSVGSLLGFSISGLLVHAIGPQRVLGLLSIPAALVFTVGILLKEVHIPDFAYQQVYQKFTHAGKTMWATFKCPEVWRPCIYMYVSLALSLDIGEGMFYWYTDATDGPHFSEGIIGFINSIGSVGSLLGVLLYQNVLQDYPFRTLLFWSQLLASLAGMLDLMLVLRLNLTIGIPDQIFAVIDNSVSQMVGNLKWLPLMVLCSKLCPPGIEGTFFALLMSIDNAGLLTSSWCGGLLLHMLSITRTEFGNLWAAVLVRNVMRLLPLSLLFLVPRADQNSSILPTAKMLVENDGEVDDVELVSLVGKSSCEALEAEVDDAELLPLVGKS